MKRWQTGFRFFFRQRLRTAELYVGDELANGQLIASCHCKISRAAAEIQFECDGVLCELKLKETNGRRWLAKLLSPCAYSGELVVNGVSCAQIKIQSLSPYISVRLAKKTMTLVDFSDPDRDFSYSICCDADEVIRVRNMDCCFPEDEVELLWKGRYSLGTVLDESTLEDCDIQYAVIAMMFGVLFILPGIISETGYVS